ncbi:MAG: hypothetical protein ABI343_05805 [Burkholderiaceae bacterium]
MPAFLPWTLTTMPLPPTFHAQTTANLMDGLGIVPTRALALALNREAPRAAVIGQSLLWIVALCERLASVPAVVVSGPDVSRRCAQ